MKCVTCGHPMSVDPKRGDLYMCRGCGSVCHRDEPEKGDPLVPAEDADVPRGTPKAPPVKGKKAKKDESRITFRKARKSTNLKGDK